MNSTQATPEGDGMSASWDEGRVVPLTRHQDTAAVSAPAGLSRPGGPDGPLGRIRSWPAARSGRASHGVARPAPRSSPTDHASSSVRNTNEFAAPLMADILGLAPPEVCDPSLERPQEIGKGTGGRVLFWEVPSRHLVDIFTRSYDGLPPLVDWEPRRHAVPGRGHDPGDWAQGLGRLASGRRYAFLVCVCALLCGALAYAADSQRLVRYGVRRVAGS